MVLKFLGIELRAVRIADATSMLRCPPPPPPTSDEEGMPGEKVVTEITSLATGQKMAMVQEYWL